MNKRIGRHTLATGQRVLWRLRLGLVCLTLLVFQTTRISTAVVVNGEALSVMSELFHNSTTGPAHRDGCSIESEYIDSQIGFLEAVRSFGAGDSECARRMFRYCKALHYRDEVAGIYLALLFEKDLQWDSAVAEWKDVGVGSPQARIYRRRAVRYFDNGDLVMGERMAWLAADLDPNSAQPLWLLAAYYRGKDNRKLLQVLELGLQVESSSSWSYIARGLLSEYSSPVDINAAIDFYETAIVTDPNESYAWERLRTAFQKSSEPGGAKLVSALLDFQSRPGSADTQNALVEACRASNSCRILPELVVAITANYETAARRNTILSLTGKLIENGYREVAVDCLTQYLIHWNDTGISEYLAAIEE